MKTAAEHHDKRRQAAQRIREIRKVLESVPRTECNRLARYMVQAEFGDLTVQRETLGDYWPVKRPMPNTLHVETGDFESWWRTWLFVGEITRDDLDSLGICAHYRAPGYAYAGRPHLQFNGHSTLVTQHGGMDI